MKILEVKNLCKNYGKGSTLVKALDDVSFSVEEGEFVAIVGSSGSVTASSDALTLTVFCVSDCASASVAAYTVTFDNNNKQDRIIAIRRFPFSLIFLLLSSFVFVCTEFRHNFYQQKNYQPFDS